MRIYKFADDSKFGRPVVSPTDASNLQSTIDRIWQWAERWGMEIHPQKTCVIHFGYANPKFTYTLNGNKIQEVTSARDLGVIINESCTPSDHVHEITRKANGILCQIRRTLVSRNKDVVIDLFKTFVRSILESAGPVWSPWEKQHIEAIERVQRRATRLVPGIGHMNYDDRLKMCNLTMLEDRRRRGDLIQLFKLLNGYSSMNVEHLFCYTSQRHNVHTRSASNNHLVAEKSRLDVRKNFFTNRVVSKWNELPIEVRETESVNSFKNLYDDFMNGKDTDIEPLSDLNLTKNA